MAGKVVVLKPMAWSTSRFVRPDGTRRNAGYVKKWGFGHEEWNGDAGRVWNGQRVFHTETTERMTAWADGRLGIIMTAYKPGVGPHALGIAVGVLVNTVKDKADIFRTLGLASEADFLWSLANVRAKHASLAELKKWWAAKGQHNNWRCQQHHYAWFEEPVRLDPERLFPATSHKAKAPEIIKMHGRFMGIRPDQALSIAAPALDAESPILRWLTEGDFDSSAVSLRTLRHGVPLPQKVAGGPQTGTAAAEPYTRYFTKHEIKVFPRHNALQERFRSFIVAAGATAIEEGKGGVDIEFRLGGRGQVLAEVKPCDDLEVRFAVRTALGQLLDYGQSRPQRPMMLVVIEREPSETDANLALSNGFALAYPHNESFVVRWP